MLRPSSGLQAFFQLTHYLAISVADIPYVCHATFLDWMQENEESRPHTQCRLIERLERAAAECAQWRAERKGAGGVA